MSKPKHVPKDTPNNHSRIAAASLRRDDINLPLEEYKLAVNVQQNYHEIAYKTVTLFVAVTALSLGFVFRASVAVQVKIIFCWFNFLISIFFLLSCVGFYIISKRIARRMDNLALQLSFGLRTHHALRYGILLTLLGGTCVFLFWLGALIFRVWNLWVPQQASDPSSFLSGFGLG